MKMHVNGTRIILDTNGYTYFYFILCHNMLAIKTCRFYIIILVRKSYLCTVMNSYNCKSINYINSVTN